MSLEIWDFIVLLKQISGVEVSVICSGWCCELWYLNLGICVLRCVAMPPKKVTHAQWNWQPCILYFNLDSFQTTTQKDNYPLLALVFPQLWGAAVLLQSCHSQKEQPVTAKSKFCLAGRILFLGKALFLQLFCWDAPSLYNAHISELRLFLQKNPKFLFTWLTRIPCFPVQTEEHKLRAELSRCL